MWKNGSRIKEFILDILFPKFCLNCEREGSYLCQDCFSLIDILEKQYCPFCSQPKIVFDGKICSSCKKSKKLAGLYCAAAYDNFIVKKMINQLKYAPYLKELAKPLASLIITHLIYLNKWQGFKDFILLSIPLHKKKLKKRGFNQASEIGKELSKILKIPFFDNVLQKIKQTPAQVDLKKEERLKNIKSSFFCKKPEIISGRKILLVDDILTTGSTLEEGAIVLKSAGAREVWGIVVARG